MRFAPPPTDPAFLARLWNLGYEGYFVPLSFTGEQMGAHLRSYDVALERSVALFDGATPVGFSLLGARDEEGWIGGFGIVPEYRRRGLAAPLIAEQLARVRQSPLRRVRLEVLEQNWARRVYAAAGFRAVRRLGVVSGRPRAEGPGAARPIELRRLLPHLERPRGGFPPVWQREAASWWDPERTDLRALRVGPGEDPAGYAVLVDDGDRGVRLVDAGARDDAAAEEVVRGLAQALPGGTLALVNEPDGSPLNRALLAAGCVETAAQHEMAWTAEGG